MEEDWSSVRINKELLKRINEFLESPIGKREGYTSAAQVINDAVRDLLKETKKRSIEEKS